MLLEVIDTLITACPVEGGRLLDSSQLTFRMLAMAYGGAEGSLVTSSILTTLARQCANDPDYFKVETLYLTHLVEAQKRLGELLCVILAAKVQKKHNARTYKRTYIHTYTCTYRHTHQHTFLRAHET